MWNRVSTEGTWRSCARPRFSFYRHLIGRYWAGGPSEAHGSPVHRICTLARKMGVRSIVVEDGLARHDVSEEVAHLEEHARVSDGDVTARTITFLHSGRRRDGDFAAIPAGAVMGQMTIITFPMPNGPRSYVYEAIFQVPGKKAGTEQLLNNHVTVAGDFTVKVGGAERELRGSYFCQQNGVTSICAHCAVRTLVRSLSQSVVTVPMLNKLWDYDPDTRSGKTDQVINVLRHFGMAAVSYDLEEDSALPDVGWDLPALLADAASPSLLVLAGNPLQHVIPILGHTMNSDEWHPIGTELHVEGRETVSSSSLWTDHLVIHDDLLGPYFCLSKTGLSEARERKLKPKFVIAVLPPGVMVSPLKAEHFGRRILSKVVADVARLEMGKGTWWRHLLEGRERRVFRTTLITRDEYLATLPDEPGLQWARDRLAKSLPARMWMCEISVPNLFLANRAKLGEILVSPDAFPEDEESNSILQAMVGFRLPSVVGWAEPAEGTATYYVAEWPERDHRPIYAPHHHGNWW